MGKKIGVITTLSVIVFFLTAFVFWGCSDSNPSGTAESAFLNDGGITNQDNQNYDDNLDNNYKPPAWPDPDIGANKYDDAEYKDHLQLASGKGVTKKSCSAVIGKYGGVVDTYVDGKYFCFMVMPQNFSEDTEVSMEINKGWNRFNEELFILNFSPSADGFKLYPVFEFQDEPDIGYNPRIIYTLYYNAAGTWIKYSSWDGGVDGIVRFYIPKLATYAILKEGGPNYRPPSSLDF